MTHGTRGMIGASWLNLAVGSLVAFTPWWTATGTAAFWNALIVGATVALLAAFDLHQETNDNAERVRGPATVNLVAGLWLLTASFAVPAGPTYGRVLGLAGGLLVLTSVYNLRTIDQLDGAASGT